MYTELQLYSEMKVQNKEKIANKHKYNIIIRLQTANNTHQTAHIVNLVILYDDTNN